MDYSPEAMRNANQAVIAECRCVDWDAKSVLGVREMLVCGQLLQRHRAYLMLLARARILPVNGRKVDASDMC